MLPSDLDTALRFVEQRALEQIAQRRTVRKEAGRYAPDSKAVSARYNAVGAWRRLFKDAVRDRHLRADLNPALQVDKPRRVDGKRMALKQPRYDQMWEFLASSGDDPELDRLLCETIVIGGARVEGLLNLTVGGLDREECTVQLDEKFGLVVDQPVPDWFVRRLHEFAVSRGARDVDDPVFIKRAIGSRPATPITDLLFDYIFSRLQAAYAWADKQQVTAHVLRHHGITVVERHASKAVARAYARHKPADVKDVYTEASREEVACAVVELYGGTHPWLTETDQSDGER